MRTSYISTTPVQAPPKFPKMDFLNIESPTKGSTVDQILDSAGMGWGTITAVAVCLCVCTVESAESRLNSLVLDCALSEWPSSSMTISHETSFMFLYGLGRGSGLLLAMILGDKYGRKVLVGAGLGLVTTFSVISAISWNFYIFVITRGLVGVGTGLCLITSYHVLSDILPSRERARVLAVVAVAAFSLGPVLVELLATLLLNSYGWRKLVISISIITSILLVLAHYLLIESPRLLFYNNRFAEAEAVLRKVVALNLGGESKGPEIIVPSTSEGNGSLADLFSPSLWRYTRSYLCVYAGVGFSLNALVQVNQTLTGDCAFSLARQLPSLVRAICSFALTLAAYDSKDSFSRRHVALLYFLGALLQIIVAIILINRVEIFTGVLEILSSSAVIAGFAITWSHTAEILHHSDIKVAAHAFLQNMFWWAQTGAYFYAPDREHRAQTALTVAVFFAVVAIIAGSAPELTERSQKSLKNRSTDEQDEELAALLFR